MRLGIISHHFFTSSGPTLEPHSKGHNLQGTQCPFSMWYVSLTEKHVAPKWKKSWKTKPWKEIPYFWFFLKTITMITLCLEIVNENHAQKKHTDAIHTAEYREELRVWGKRKIAINSINIRWSKVTIERSIIPTTAGISLKQHKKITAQILSENFFFSFLSSSLWKLWKITFLLYLKSRLGRKWRGWWNDDWALTNRNNLEVPDKIN